MDVFSVVCTRVLQKVLSLIGFLVFSLVYFKMRHCTWMVCWIANNTRLFRSNCFPTDRVISNWMQSYTLNNSLVALEHGPSKGWSGVHLLHDNASSHKCEVVKTFLASEKVKVLNHPPYSPDLSPCDFVLFPGLKKMLSGNKYTSRSSLGSAIYQRLHQIPKEDYLSAFRDWVKGYKNVFQ